MGEIEDIVIKTIMSATAQILPAINCFVPHNQNCFGNQLNVYNNIDENLGQDVYAHKNNKILHYYFLNMQKYTFSIFETWVNT